MELRRSLSLFARYEHLGFAERRASAFLRLIPVAGSALDPVSRSPRRDQFPHWGVTCRAHDARASDQPGDPILDLFDLAQTPNALTASPRELGYTRSFNSVFSIRLAGFDPPAPRCSGSFLHRCGPGLTTLDRPQRSLRLVRQTSAVKRATHQRV